MSSTLNTFKMVPLIFFFNHPCVYSLLAQWVILHSFPSNPLFLPAADISKKKIVSTICNDVMYYVPRMASSTLPSATQWTTANTACQGGLVVASELSPCGISFAKKVNTLFGVDASEIWSSQRDVSIDLAAFVGETPTTQSNSSSSVTFLPLCQGEI